MRDLGALCAAKVDVAKLCTPAGRGERNRAAACDLLSWLALASQRDEGPMPVAASGAAWLHEQVPC